MNPPLDVSMTVRFSPTTFKILSNIYIKNTPRRVERIEGLKIKQIRAKKPPKHQYERCDKTSDSKSEIYFPGGPDFNIPCHSLL